MTALPKISVITPTYNQAEFIEETLGEDALNVARRDEPQRDILPSLLE